MHRLRRTSRGPGWDSTVPWFDCGGAGRAALPVELQGFGRSLLKRSGDRFSVFSPVTDDIGLTRRCQRSTCVAAALPAPRRGRENQAEKNFTPRDLALLCSDMSHAAFTPRTPKLYHFPIFRVNHIPEAEPVLACLGFTPLRLVCRCADQPADDRADGCRAKRDQSDVAAAMMRMVNNDMMPRRGRAMRTMPPPMPRRSNRRTCRQRQSCEKNRNRFNGLVHITPATFCLACFAGAHLPLTQS